MSADSGPGLREVAYRMFAAEFDDADFSYSESDEERAPNYVVTPTGARVNRMFLTGVLTEVEPVGEDMLRARIVDPTGAFVVYAGQYQPDALAFLERAEPPMFLAVTGKARTFQPEDADVVYTSVRPETISEVDAETRDRWVVTTAEQTIERIKRMARAKELDLSGDELVDALVEQGVDDEQAEGIALALDHYDTSTHYLSAVRDLAIEAVQLVADEVEEVSPLEVSPGEPGEADLDELVGTETVTETEAAAEATTEPLSEPPTTAEPTGSEASSGEAASSAGASAEAHPAARTGSGPEEPMEGVEAEEVETETEEAAKAEAEHEPEVESPGEFESEEFETEPEPESEPEVEVESEIGEVEADSTEPGEPEVGEFETEPEGVEPEAFEPEDFELDEEVRERVEETYGTEFSTGSEVAEPGEAGIGTPEEEPIDEPLPESEEAEAEAEDEVEEAVEVEETAEEETEAEPEPPAEEVNLETAVMETMESLNEGDGVDRSELVSAVTDQYGASAADVEDAIQSALMSGRCYEPSEDLLKPI